MTKKVPLDRLREISRQRPTRNAAALQSGISADTVMDDVPKEEWPIRASLQS
jgi:hypothetical protein